MARKLYYRIADDGRNHLTDPEWEEILRLQRWYNAEFSWSAGRLAFKMFAVFPREGGGEESAALNRRMDTLRREGLSENAALEVLAAKGLVTVKKGGYVDGSLASGFTRVAGNEFNAYLVCDFLLKASRIARASAITLRDEGEFVKPHEVRIARGTVTALVHDAGRLDEVGRMVEHRRLFAVVDPAKYDRYPHFEPTVAEFNGLPPDERQEIVRDWRWLGFGSNFDLHGDDVQGFDLNRKVDEFLVEAATENA